MGFYESNDPTNSVKALKEDWILKIRLQSHQICTNKMYNVEHIIIFNPPEKFKKYTMQRKHANIITGISIIIITNYTNFSHCKYTYVPCKYCIHVYVHVYCTQHTYLTYTVFQKK